MSSLFYACTYTYIIYITPQLRTAYRCTHLSCTTIVFLLFSMMCQVSYLMYCESHIINHTYLNWGLLSSAHIYHTPPQLGFRYLMCIFKISVCLLVATCVNRFWRVTQENYSNTTRFVIIQI